MNRRHSITLWLLALCLTAKAVDGDTTLVEHTGLWQTTTAAMRQNPALHGVAFASSFSQLYAEVDWQHQSQAFVPQEGRGFLLSAAQWLVLRESSEKSEPLQGILFGNVHMSLSFHKYYG